MSKRPWNNNTYPWHVGYRLKKSHKTLPYRQARAYFRELKKRKFKSRFIWQAIPLGVLMSWTLELREPSMLKALTDPNPLLALMKRNAGINSFEGGSTIKKELKYE